MQIILHPDNVTNLENKDLLIFFILSEILSCTDINQLILTSNK